MMEPLVTTILMLILLTILVSSGFMVFPADVQQDAVVTGPFLLR